MSDGMRRELAYLSSHATNRYFIPNWGSITCRIFLWKSWPVMQDVHWLRSEKIFIRPFTLLPAVGFFHAD